jgi:endo-1,4-beta-xylanase
VFYTSKPRKDSEEHEDSLSYVAAPTLEELNSVPRTKLKDIVGEDVIAVQVFYFEPQRLWYLVGHISLGKPHLLQPVYLTNPDIEKVKGWSEPKPLLGKRVGEEPFWIDFWVICDDEKAHIFYTDHICRVFRVECPLEEFPLGFNSANEVLATSDQGEDDTGPWHLHEGSHIYRVKEDGRYLALLEGAYTHPTRAPYWDSRNRFMFAMTADRLEGPWKRVEARENEFLADASQLRGPDGDPVFLHQVSHPELIRSGNNQRLEIDNYKLQLVFQAFDASQTPDDYDYDMLPWSLWLARNH